jgi:hypothetical protein
VFDEVGETHHQIVEDVGPHVDAGHDLLVYQGLLELVRLQGQCVNVRKLWTFILLKQPYSISDAYIGLIDEPLKLL